MDRPAEYEDLSYYDMVKGYKWKPTKKGWGARTDDAIVQIFPRKWLEGLKPDPTKPANGEDTPTFATAARRALMLYIPFRDLGRLSDVYALEDPTREVQPYDPTDTDYQNNVRWKFCFWWHFRHSNNRFPRQLVNMYLDITAAEFDLEIDPDGNNSDDEWAPTPEIQRRHEQEWERLGRLALHGQHQMGQPREFFGFRDVDLFHDWASDLRQYQLVPDLETFVASNRQQMGVGGMVDEPVVLPEMLNAGQREVYDYVVGGFRHPLAGFQQLNTVVMGTAGVGKSFLIRALESGIWQAAKDKYGEGRYPTIRWAFKLPLSLERQPTKSAGSQFIRCLLWEMCTTHGH